jgi:sugar phosphate isomerase/epimerase
MTITRRQFVATIAAASAGALPLFANESKSDHEFKLGLVTYNWGKAWDIKTLIKNCEATQFGGVELRSTHQHRVEITLGKSERKEVAKQFSDSKVELVGLGSACEYHSPDADVVKKNIEDTKAFVKLCHDVGGKGVKVRPNGIPKDVPVEKTLEQIGKSLRVVAKFAADYDVKIRVEVHGRESAKLPYIKSMMDTADHPNAVVCWNCNPTDLIDKGLTHNFDLVKKKIDIIHIHDLRNDNYPWQKLFTLLKSAEFHGWTLLEEGKVPKDIVGAMRENRTVWEKLVKSA